MEDIDEEIMMINRPRVCTNTELCLYIQVNDCGFNMYVVVVRKHSTPDLLTEISTYVTYVRENDLS